MPPKKQPSKLAAAPAAPPVATARAPLPPPVPPRAPVLPLWTPACPPPEVFPEWPVADAFPPEYWHSIDAPYEDPTPASALPVPFETRSDEVTWKRPRDFMPLIVDTRPTTPAALPPVTADPKNAKKAPPPAAKKPEGDRKTTAPPAPPKHAHIFLVDDNVPGHRIPRDFRRSWSDEERELLGQWRREEIRVELARQQRERVYMAFEDAIAYIINERPRGDLDDVEVDPEDLEDDEQDDGDGDEAEAEQGESGSAASPWGVLPPARMDIAPNTVIKPEMPHGEVVHAGMASIFRLVEQLIEAWQIHEGPAKSMFLWRAIFPQNAQGVPVYNPGGKYSVRLFVLGKWRCVDVDDQLPVDSAGQIAYASSSNSSEIWPALLTKAIFKALQWLQIEVEPIEDDPRGETATRMVAQILLLLTGWKTTRWQAGAATSFSENVYYQLLPFVPPNDPQTSESSDSQSVDPVESETPSTQPTHQPRALLVCIAENGSLPLRFGEAAALNAIVGDAGNTMFKVNRHGTPANLPEDAAGASTSSIGILLAYSPPTTTASVLFTWAIPPPVDGEEAPTALTAFENPPALFAVIHSERQEEKTVVVATLTPVPGASAEALAAAEQLKLDPRGSLALVEEDTSSRVPTLATLNTIASSRLELPPSETQARVFRLRPSSSLLQLGFSLEIESSSPSARVEIVDAAGLWRAKGFHVEEAHGTLRVLSPGSWNVVTQLSIGFEGEEGGPVELRVDAHVPEAALARRCHVWLIHTATGAVTNLPALNAVVSLPESGTYALVLDCATPFRQHVRPGAWRITLASPRSFVLDGNAAAGPVATTFSGSYEPNHEFLLFRDVVVAPSTTSATTCRLELVGEGSDRLAVQLRVFDAGQSEDTQPVVTKSGIGAVILLHLPSLPGSTGRWILEGQIDHATCVIPPSLCSRRPFRVDVTTGDLKASVRWKLQCWSSEEVKLEADMATAKRHEMERQKWAEAARDRGTSGAASRLLYLGQNEAADARLQQETQLSEEQVAKVRERAEWLQTALQAVKERYLAVVPLDPATVRVCNRDELVCREDELTTELQRVQTEAETRREARTIAKEQRAVELKELVQSVIERRAAAAKSRAARREKILELVTPKASTTA